MKQKLLILTIGLFISILCIGQQQKIYYDSEWKVCKNSTAKYYRLITLDESGNPVGKVKDYYISGELQWEGYLSYFDRYDNSKDVMDRLCIWYYKNGYKSRESNMKNNIKIGTTILWDEYGFINSKINYDNGSIISERNYYYYYYDDDNKSLKAIISVNAEGKRDGSCFYYNENGILTDLHDYKNDKQDGLSTWYDDSGEIKLVNEYVEGEPIDKFWIEYNKYEKIFSKTFKEYFSNSENKNGWDIVSTKESNTKIIPGKGILFDIKNKSYLNSFITLKLNPDNMFTIQVIVKNTSGKENNIPYGIKWGVKDHNNENGFYITTEGYYSISSLKNGIFNASSPEKSYAIKSGINTLKINKIENTTYFSINGILIHSIKYIKLYGDLVGFTSSGSSKVLFKSIIVDQHFPTKDYNKLITKYEKNVQPNKENSTAIDWRGNGTGFFIDRNGYIATNYHVIKDANVIEVEFIRNGIRQTYSAKIIQSDKQNDLSVIKINSSEFKPFMKLPYNFKTKISDVASNVFALGYPMALSLLGTEIKFTDGKISSKTGMHGDITTYQISVPIQPGNSGGPLFDYDGNLIGITSSSINRKLDITENVNYAIKSNYLINLIDVLDYNISLPNDKSITNKTLTEKIKILSDYVVLIKIK